jgi:hypothetical protein
MDAKPLVDLLRTLSISPSRRGLMAGLVSGVSTHIAFGSASSSAKPSKRKKKKKKSPGSGSTCVCDQRPAAPCIPQCEGRVCGGDGCGGICGVACLQHEECREGACVCTPDAEICRRGDHFHCFAKCGENQVRDVVTCQCCGTTGRACTPGDAGGCCRTWVCKGTCASGGAPCQSDTDCGPGEGPCGTATCVAE